MVVAAVVLVGVRAGMLAPVSEAVGAGTGAAAGCAAGCGLCCCPLDTLLCSGTPFGAAAVRGVTPSAFAAVMGASV